jgi:hypothetical protein
MDSRGGGALRPGTTSVTDDERSQKVRITERLSVNDVWAVDLLRTRPGITLDVVVYPSLLRSVHASWNQTFGTA